MKNFYLFLLCILFKVSFSASYLKVLYISHQKPSCDSIENCLLVSDSPTDSFRLFTNPIQGFTYQIGFDYCLLVEVQTSENKTDSVPVKYVLSEIKSKIKKDYSKTQVITAILDSSKWLLYKIRMKDGSTKTFSIQKAYIQFDLKNNTISGNTDCNNFNASFSLDTSALKFENIITTKMACGKHAIEPIFLNLLNITTNYKIKSKLLYLYKEKTLIGLFTLKK